VAGAQTRTPSEVRWAQQSLTQSASALQSALHTAGLPAQMVFTPLGSAQQSESREHAPPTGTVHPAVERHHALTVHARDPSVSAAQQLLRQSESARHVAVQSWPAPNRRTHCAGTPDGSAQHSDVARHSVPVDAVHIALQEPQGPKPEPSGRQVCTPVSPPAHAQAADAPGTQARGSGVPMSSGGGGGGGVPMSAGGGGGGVPMSVAVHTQAPKPVRSARQVWAPIAPSVHAQARLSPIAQAPLPPRRVSLQAPAIDAEMPTTAVTTATHAARPTRPLRS
jgi:hypothetical protein